MALRTQPQPAMRIKALSRKKTHQQGSALVVVLLIFALAYSLAVEVIYRQDHVQTRTANLLDWDYRYQYAIAAETLAIQGLIDDLEDDQRNNEIMDDCVTEKWAGPFSFPYDDAIISASVQDLQGRFNVNALMESNQSTGQFSRDQNMMPRFQTLLSSVLPSTHTSYAAGLANQMADWIDTDNLVNGADGAEDAEYLYSRTPNHPIMDESEMRALFSFDESLASEINKAQRQAPNNATASTTGQPMKPAPRFMSYFTALPLFDLSGAVPGPPKLNVNTAPQAVLEAYFSLYGAQAAAATIVQDRAKQPYLQVADVLALSDFSKLTVAQRPELESRLSVSTEYFQVVIDVGMESGVSRLVTRIQRQAQGETRVISRALMPVLEPLEPACNPD
ncbi:MAG: type II secretion system protein GspK [Alcanivoracaceae bacterium]|nr:type II secretion system protein GspK [Alcanivoracaceae bacterium]